MFRTSLYSFTFFAWALAVSACDEGTGTTPEAPNAGGKQDADVGETIDDPRCDELFCTSCCEARYQPYTVGGTANPTLDRLAGQVDWDVRVIGSDEYLIRVFTTRTDPNEASGPLLVSVGYEGESRAWDTGIEADFIVGMRREDDGGWTIVAETLNGERIGLYVDFGVDDAGSPLPALTVSHEGEPIRTISADPTLDAPLLTQISDIAYRKDEDRGVHLQLLEIVPGGDPAINGTEAMLSVIPFGAEHRDASSGSHFPLRLNEDRLGFLHLVELSLNDKGCDADGLAHFDCEEPAGSVLVQVSAQTSHDNAETFVNELPIFTVAYARELVAEGTVQVMELAPRG